MSIFGHIGNVHFLCPIWDLSEILITSFSDMSISDRKFFIAISDNRYPPIITRPLACLPSNKDEDFEGTKVITRGWGNTKFNGTISQDLLYALVTVISNEDCYKNQGIITANMICAKGDNYLTDTCLEESGGPVIASVNNRVTLVEFTSYGLGGGVQLSIILESMLG
jgi:hypothetical protein